MATQPACSECIKGSIHSGLPIGTEETIHGLNTYVTGNRTSPRAIIVMYSDIFGLKLPNNKLLADAYAASGEYLVYQPDFFHGDPVPLRVADVAIPVDATKQSTFAKYTGILASMPTFLMWMTRHKHADCDRECMEWLAKLRRDTPVERKIGMVGICWGGRYALRAGLESNVIDVNGVRKPLIDAVTVLHPSNLVLPDDVEMLAVPTSFAWGVEDIGVSYKLKGRVEELYAKRKEKPEMEHRSYTPGRHGFAVRGNPEDERERACLEGAERQVLEWMGRWL